MDQRDIDAIVRRALEEDLPDVTSEAIFGPEDRGRAGFVVKADGVICGLPFADATFRTIDPASRFTAKVKDGDRVRPGDIVAEVEGSVIGLLSGERPALNLLQRASGIATATRRYVDAIAGTGAVLIDTRKTLPGLRVLEKFAVRMGGAQNHRMRLDDGVLIKDNHVAVCGGVAEAVRRAKASNTGLQVQVEVDRIDQIEPALSAGADRLLLDNMPPPVLREAVSLVAGRVPLEASGGVTLETIRAIAETGVDYISVGRITQSAPAVDIGLDYRLD